MNIDTRYLERCIATLNKAYSLLMNADPEHIDYEMYRSACIKEFELILEQSGKLLRKVLKPYFHTDRTVDQLTFKDVFRHAVLRSLMDTDTCERWLEYRDNRNTTAHDFGASFADETLLLLPQFIEDATELVAIIQQKNTE